MRMTRINTDLGLRWGKFSVQRVSINHPALQIILL